MAWYDKWAIMVIGTAIGLAGYEGVPWCKMGVAEWAYWVGAIGTVGTLAGTIWLATAESRRRHEEKVTLAIVVAVDWIFRLMFIQACVASAIKTLHVESDDFDLPDYASCIKTLDAIDAWSSADVAPLIVAGRDIATNLMSASSNIRGSIPLIKRIEERVTHDVVAHTTGVEKNIANRLRFASEKLNAASQELAIFLDMHREISTS